MKLTIKQLKKLIKNVLSSERPWWHGPFESDWDREMKKLCDEGCLQACKKIEPRMKGPTDEEWNAEMERLGLIEMKITNKQLKQIIKEELEIVLSEENLKQQKQRYKNEDEAYKKLQQKYGKSLYGASKEELMTIGLSEEDVQQIIANHEKMKTTKQLANVAKQKAKQAQDKVDKGKQEFDKLADDLEMSGKLMHKITLKIISLNDKKLLSAVNNNPQEEAKIDKMINNFQNISNDVLSLFKQKKYDEIRKKYFNFIKEEIE